MTVSYFPSSDELSLEFRPLRRKPNKVIEGIRLWWNDRGNICGITIEHFVEELKQFKRRRNTIQLGGIWKEIQVTDKEIQDVRQDLLEKLGENW